MPRDGRARTEESGLAGEKHSGGVPPDARSYVSEGGPENHHWIHDYFGFHHRSWCHVPEIGGEVAQVELGLSRATSCILGITHGADYLACIYRIYFLLDEHSANATRR